MAKPRNVRELRDSGWKRRSVKQEMRDNLIARLKRGEAFLPGIVGYDDTVVPQIENAILSGQDLIFLGERGQAKTRIARMLIGLLDEELPALAGCEINDDPLAPICQACRQLRGQGGRRRRRRVDRRATAATARSWPRPDITIADLIGEVDPIKVAEGRYLSDELTIHYGLLPRTHRGIFAINELPDLAERIQVGLLNIMEERDVQIRGYKVRLPLDLYVVASANPEDYTNRGRIITPLKDRFGSQVRTHYPKKLADEIAIMEAERTAFPVDGVRSVTPGVHEAGRGRADAPGPRSPPTSASAPACRCACPSQLREPPVQRAQARDPARRERGGAARERPRRPGRLHRPARSRWRPSATAARTRSSRRCVQQGGAQRLQPLVRRRRAGRGGEGLRGRASPCRRPTACRRRSTSSRSAQMPALRAAAAKLGATEPAGVAAAVEFVLEGLHLTKKLNKDVQAGRYRYRV